MKHGEAVYSMLPKGPDPRSNMIWDILGAAPLLTSAPEPRVLMLGAGLGTAVHVSEWAMGLVKREAEYTVVDPDEEVLTEMRKHLNLPVRYYLEEAGSYVAGQRDRFDVVIEDTFVKFTKPDWVDQKLELAMALVKKEGVFVMNMMCHQLPHYKHRIKAIFPALVEVYMRGYPNAVVFGSKSIEAPYLAHLVEGALRFVARPAFFDTIEVRITR